ncbi:MAG: hypothetical protein Q2306_02090 [Phytoplasma sp.]|uniref:hypothetical protein n=1 Tax=Phytoplasma sp. TaxID=2155 RepID=UPI002B40B1E8|nr:hypothetical protein [Phytoplasma sp.]WRH06664.1 MAG: hypothetical protein Q2306_02090 [Phytoplasma sp.]
MKNYINKIYFLFIIILFICLFINPWFYNLDKIEKEEIIIQEFDWDLNNCFCDAVIFKIAKKFSYILGSSCRDLEKQFLQNYITVYKNDNIVYDEKNKKLIVKNINFLMNTKIFFARSYLKIIPGIYKIRDNIFLDLNIYFKFIKNKDKYKLNSFVKIKYF